MNNMVSIILKPGKDQSAKRFHPWIFSGAIRSINGTVNEGDLVAVYSNEEKFLGIGHYQPSSIAVRILSFEKKDLNREFWRQKIRNAVRLRETLGLHGNRKTNVYRLINAEGDGMPGLIVDYYKGVAVMQTHSVGMFLIRNQLAEMLKEILGKPLLAVYNKSDKTLPYKAGIAPADGYISGKAVSNLVKENGLLFNTDWETGQKTGFYIDQRENRKWVQSYAKNRDVLNLFSYSGSFSVYALKGGARFVHSVDSSEKAIRLARENIALNFSQPNHEAFIADAFEYLQGIRNKYDLIILDPPAFAKHHNTVSRALQGYKRINKRAFEQIRPGGILCTFSCSQVVSKEKFREAVFTAAALSGRNVRILNQLTQSADHPVNIYHPEGEYLKGLVLFVE